MLFITTVNHALARFGLHEWGNAPFPRQPAPMLVEKAATLFDDPAWTYEPKWDGFRMLASVRDGSVRLISRNGHSFTNLFWPVSDALRGFPDPETVEREAAVAGDVRLAWPAPGVPTYAIDDIEHDLATLHTLLVAPHDSDTTRGRARYLLELNDCL